MIDAERVTASAAATRVREDFERDFASAPVAWHVECAPEAEALALGRELARQARSAGNVLLEDRASDAGEMPGLWFPAAYVRVVTDLAPPAGLPIGWPPTTARVLLRIAAQSSPEPIPPGWDECFAAGRADVPELCRRISEVARSRQIAALVNAIDRPPPAGCRISVVVCTYRRPASLARAIASVATQTLDEDEYEILVVNNDPDDVAVRETVAGTCTRFLPREPARLRLVQCPFPGLSFARNAGIAQARGAIVSFIDDDAVARPDWLERISQVFTDHPDAGVVGGRITLHLPEPRPRWAKPAWRKYWSERATDLHAPTVVGHWWDYPWGANWSARRDVLLAIGGFRTGYGRRGTDAAGGEEIVAASLVQRLGHAIVVAPAAEVIHVPDAARFTLAHVWRRIQATKREEYQQQRQGYLPDPMTLGTTAWAVGRHLRRACIGPRLAPYERLEHLMYACAEARLLVPLLRDRAARS